MALLPCADNFTSGGLGRVGDEVNKFCHKSFPVKEEKIFNIKYQTAFLPLQIIFDSGEHGHVENKFNKF